MIKNIVSKYAEQLVVFLLISLSVAVAKLVYNFLLVPLLEAGQGKTIIKIAALILGLFLGSLLYIFYLHRYKIRPKSRIQNDYKFDENTGIYRHNKTGQLFCGTCMLEGIEAQLVTLQYGWACQRKGCLRRYSDPENPRPAKRKTVSRGLWMNGVKKW